MSQFQILLVVVSRGLADAVIQTAHGAGALGGTIVPCRGSGHHDLHELMHVPLDTERELVIILSPESTTKAVAEAINGHLALDEPGNGLLITLAADRFGGDVT